jgi:hypothetical protein
MRAAQQAITDLQEEARQLRESNTALERFRWWSNFRQILAGFIAAALVVGYVFGIQLYYQQRNISRAQQHSNIAACQDGNKYRAQQTQIWDFFVGVLASQKASAGMLADARSVKDYLARVAGGDPRLEAEAQQFGALLDRLIGQTKDPQLPAIVHHIESYIAAVNAPRNCVRLYAVASLPETREDP